MWLSILSARGLCRGRGGDACAGRAPCRHGAQAAPLATGPVFTVRCRVSGKVSLNRNAQETLTSRPELPGSDRVVLPGPWFRLARWVSVAALRNGTPSVTRVDCFRGPFAATLLCRIQTPRAGPATTLWGSMLEEGAGPRTGAGHAPAGPAPGHGALCVVGVPLADHVQAPPPEHGAHLLFPPGDEREVPSWKPEDGQ